MAIAATRERDVQRFLSKILVMTSGCWEFQGKKNNSGYGRFSVYRKSDTARILAHRFMMSEVQGVDIEGKVLLHSCDNPPCVNPAHLTVGTQSDNMRDARAKGRLDVSGLAIGQGARGEARGTSKLTDADVLRIRELRAAGLLQAEIADRFGVTRFTIGQILRGRTWTHV